MRLLAITGAVALALALGTAAEAAQGDSPLCPPGTTCPQPKAGQPGQPADSGHKTQSQKSQAPKAQPGTTQTQKSQAHKPQTQTAQPRKADSHQPPRIGDSARGGRPFVQAQNSRLPRPASGQEYRVVDDRLVRVDSDTLKIVAIIGLLNEVLK